MSSRRPLSFRLSVALAASLLALAGCASKSPQRVSYDPEAFNSTDTHTRAFDATEAQVCEGARRALLSQGYLVTAANAELVTGKKSFQPASEVHVELEFRVVCASESGRKRASATPPRTLVFVSALQDRYSLKKVNNSASVGVGVLGSVSLPYSSSDDSLVKVASQTVADERFYDRFFGILQRYIVLDVAEPSAPATTAPVVFPTVTPPQALAPLPPAPAPEAAPATDTASANAATTPPAQPVQMRAPPVPVEPLGVPSSMPPAQPAASEASAADTAAKAMRN